MKRAMLAVIAAAAFGSTLLPINARANALSDFGENVACTIGSYVLRIPGDLCVFASAEFANDIRLTVLSKKAEAYCGTSNLNAAKQMFDLDMANYRKQCAAVLVVACARHGHGC